MKTESLACKLKALPLPLLVSSEQSRQKYTEGRHYMKPAAMKMGAHGQFQEN